jgi:hypothetical protein
MKASLKTLSLVSAVFALLATSCASHHHSAGVRHPDHFYCHMCDMYHPYHHAHYRVYYSDDYHYHRAPASSSSRTTVVVKPPGLPVPPPPPGDPLRKILP